jgi:hypothetical protein
VDTNSIAAKQARADEIGALATHANMPKALRTLSRGIVELFVGNRLLNLLVSDRGRVVMGCLALYLDAGHDPRNPLSGLTVNRFKAQCAETGVCSAGRAAAMLGLMRFAGYLEPAQRTQRGLPLRLVPTERLVEPLRQRWRAVFVALAQLRPEGEAGLALLDDPAFTKAFVRAVVHLFRTRERIVAHGPAMELFIDRKAGFVVLMNMMLSAAPGDDMPPRAPLPVSVVGLARRFAVSRGQIKDILQSAVAAELLEPVGADQSAYLITPRLREGILHFFAALFVLVTDGIAEAERSMRAGDAPMEGAA